MTINRKNKTICDFHTNILDIAEECLNMKFDENSARETFNYLLNKMNDIYWLSEMALTAGQNMEDRLYEYREAIEGLGFTRNKKGEE